MLVDSMRGNPDVRATGNGVWQHVGKFQQWPHQKCPFRWGSWILMWYVVPWANPSPHPKWHLDRFSHLCRAYSCYRQTDQPKDRPCYSVCSNRPHLASAAMRPNNKVSCRLHTYYEEQCKNKARIILPFVFELYSECKIFENKNKTLTIKNVFLAAKLLFRWIGGRHCIYEKVVTKNKPLTIMQCSSLI